MTKREELIQKVRDGNVAILNDGNIEQLREIVTLCFPLSEKPSGGNHFYKKHFDIKDNWVSEVRISLPTVSVKEFYEDEFVWGEEVEVSNNNQIWFVRYYIAKSPQSNAHIAATIGDLVFGWKYIRKLPLKIKLTYQIIADKFDIDVNNLEII